jgi:hypothetical protein
MQQLYAVFFLLPRFGINLTEKKFLLPLQLALALQAICVQAAFRNRRLHGATRLAGMTTIAIFALRR